MNIVAISDLHGNLPDMSQYGKIDLLLIAGDICPAYDHSYQFQYNWLKDTFVPWIQQLPYANAWSKVVFTPGNHDFWFQREKPNSSKYIADIGCPCQGRFIYLRNEPYTFDYIGEGGKLKSLRIFGTPWCHQFGNWAFMCSDDKLRERFSEIPEDVDILLTHDAPYGCSDICYQGRSVGKHIGSEPLREVILEKKPKLCIHGHLHTTNHEMMALGITRVINVSLLDEAYSMVYEPFILEDSWFEEERKEKYDEEYVFPNRDEAIVKLIKVEDEYALWTNAYTTSVHYSGENSSEIYMIDPSGGPCLCQGAKWYDFTIDSIRKEKQMCIFKLIKD